MCLPGSLLLSGASAVASPECLSSRYSSGDASAQLGSPLPQRLTRGHQRSARLASLSQRFTLSRGSRDARHYGTRRSQPSRAHARRVLGSQVLGSRAPFCGSRAPVAKMRRRHLRSAGRPGRSLASAAALAANSGSRFGSRQCALAALAIAQCREPCTLLSVHFDRFGEAAVAS